MQPVGFHRRGGWATLLANYALNLILGSSDALHRWHFHFQGTSVLISDCTGILPYAIANWRHIYVTIHATKFSLRRVRSSAASHTILFLRGLNLLFIWPSKVCKCFLQCINLFFLRNQEIFGVFFRLLSNFWNFCQLIVSIKLGKLPLYFVKEWTFAFLFKPTLDIFRRSLLLFILSIH